MFECLILVDGRLIISLVDRFPTAAPGGGNQPAGGAGGNFQEEADDDLYS